MIPSRRPADHPLIRLGQVVVTPHLGASTEEAQVSVAVEAAKLLIDFLARGQVRFAVNMPALDRAELEDVRHDLNLAWRLGMLHSQMDRGTLKNARITYRGEVAHKNTKLITASFAAGLMESALEAAGQPGQRAGAGARTRDRDRRTLCRGAWRLRHADSERGHDRAQDLRRLGNALRQAVPQAGPTGDLSCSTPTWTARFWSSRTAIGPG